MQKGRLFIVITMILCFSLTLFSCITAPVTVTSSTTPLYNKRITENLGVVKGEDRVWSVFGLWMVGRPDMDRAIEKALKVKGGDALINVKCYKKTGWFFFVSSHRVIVEGEAVKLADIDVKAADQKGNTKKRRAARKKKRTGKRR